MFKVGDEVRVVATKYGFSTDVVVGTTGTLSHIYEGRDTYDEVNTNDNFHRISTKDGTHIGLVYDSEIELVPEKSDNISVSSSIIVTILEDEYTLTKEEARELSEKLIKELS
jgi:hypothetical protein